LARRKSALEFQHRAPLWCIYISNIDILWRDVGSGSGRWNHSWAQKARNVTTSIWLYRLQWSLFEYDGQMHST
jgi:hypothetical protein